MNASGAPGDLAPTSSRRKESLFHAVLAIAGFAVAIWAYVRIPEVALNIPRWAEPPTPAWAGMSVWSIGACIGVFSVCALVLTLSPPLEQRFERFRVAGWAVVLLVLFLILWFGRI